MSSGSPNIGRAGSADGAVVRCLLRVGGGGDGDGGDGDNLVAQLVRRQ